MHTASPRRALAAIATVVAVVAGSFLIAAPASAAEIGTPTGLTPTGLIASTPDATWVPVPGADFYQTQVSTTSAAGPFSGSLGNFGASVPNSIFTLPEGVTVWWQVRAVVGDVAGDPSAWQLGNWSAAAAVTLDSVAPIATLSLPAPGLVVKPGTLVPYSGTVVDAHAKIAYVGIASPGGVTAGLRYDTSGLATVSGTIDTTGYASGTHTVRLEARDAVGNKSAASVATATFTVDADAPDVVITSPANASFVKPGTPVNFTATIADVSPWIYYSSLDGNGLDYAYGSTLTNYSRVVPTTGWANGSTHIFRFEAKDAFNQKDTGSVATASVTADSSAPVVSFTSPAVGSRNAGAVTVSGTATDTGSGIASFTLKLRPINSNGNCGGFGTSIEVPVAANGTWTATLASGAEADGTYCLTALASDRVGNGNGGGNSLKSFVIDNTAPSLPTNLAPGGWNLTADRFSWNASTDASGPVTYDLVLGAHPSLDANGKYANIVAEYPGLTSPQKLFAFANTGYHWQVRAVDALGNASAWVSSAVQIIGVPSVTAPTAGLRVNASTLVGTWTAVNGIGGVQSYEIEYGVDRDHDGILQADEYVTRTVPGTQLSRVQTFSTDFSGLLSIKVRAVYVIGFSPYDPSSNLGPWSAEVFYERDAVAPGVLQPINPANGTTLAGSSRTFDWIASTATDIAGYEVRTSTSPSRTTNATSGDQLNGADAATVAATSDSLAVSGLPEGWTWWQVRAIDTLGNAGRWSSIWATGVDTLAPAVVTLTSPTQDAVETDGDFSLVWQQVEPGVSYQVRSSTVAPVAGELADPTGGGSATTSATSFPLAGVPDAVYYWQVRATDAVGNVGPWSEVRTVTVQTPAPATVAGSGSGSGGTGASGPGATGTGTTARSAARSAAGVPSGPVSLVTSEDLQLETKAFDDDGPDTTSAAAAETEATPELVVEAEPIWLANWWWLILLAVAIVAAIGFILRGMRRSAA